MRERMSNARSGRHGDIRKHRCRGGDAEGMEVAMRLRGKLQLTGLAALTLALTLVFGAESGLAEGSKREATTYSRAAIELYKSISRSLVAQDQQPRSDDLQPQQSPANDLFANAQRLSGERGRVRGSNVGATAEPGEPAHARFGGISSVWYTLTPDRTRIAILDTFRSDFDTVLAVYTGDMVDDLVEVASNDDTDLTRQSRVIFRAEAGTTYRIAVDGFEGAQGNIVLSFKLSDDQRPSPNDNFNNAIALEGQQGSVTGNNIGATVQPGELPHAGVGAGSSVWYTFTADRSRLTTLDVLTSAFVPVIAVYEGGSVSALTEVASSPALERLGTQPAVRSAFQASVMFLAEAGTTYRIAVDANARLEEDFGREGFFSLDFRRTNQRPSPNDDFSDAIALEGQQGRIRGNTVGASLEPGEPAHAGLDDLLTTSVWYTFTPNDARNTVIEVRSETISFFPALAVYQGDSVDDLTEVASGSFGTVAFRSEPGATYRIAVFDRPDKDEGLFTLDFRREDVDPPANDDFEDRIAIEDRRGTFTGTTLGATGQGGEPEHAFGGGTRSVWYSFTPEATGITTVDTFGSSFDTVLAVYSGDQLDQLQQVASNDDAMRRWSRVAFLAEQGTEYHIAVDGAAGEAGDFTLNFEQTARRRPANDNFANARRLRGERGTDNGFNVNATAQPGEPPHAGSGPDSSVWWRWRAPFTDLVTFTTSESTFDTVLAVYTVDTVDNLVGVASDDDSVGFQSLVVFEAQEGQVYHIAVDGFDGAQGSIALAFIRGEGLLKRF
jgi:hypothetical protein